MKSILLLQQLKTQLEQLAKAVEPLAEQRTQRALFDNQLFRCHSTRLGDYLTEIRQTLEQLKDSVTESHPQRVAWLAERVVLQIGALQREIATRSLRQREAPVKNHLDTPDQKLAQYHDVERRLIAMINDRESLLGKQETLLQQQKMQQELERLEERLSRCREAILLMENDIQQRDGY